MPEIIFETPRLVARHIGLSDLADMLAVYGDEDAMRWVGDGKPITREEAVRWLQVTADNYRQRGYGMSYIIATTDPDNVASHRVLVKAGMTRGQLLLEDDGSSTRVFEWHAE